MRPALACAALLGLANASCHRRSEDAVPSAAPSAVRAAPVEPSGLVDLPRAMALADVRFEARRGTITSLPPVLGPHLAALEAHWKGRPPFPLSFQVAPVKDGRVAILLQATEGEARPFAILLDPGGAAVWVKNNPLGGVKPGVSEPALASGPGGHTALAWCNASTSSVALRQWAEDGGAFADYEALHFDSCDALTVLYWAGRGWLLAVAWKGGALLQFVTENGQVAWGRNGMPLPWTWRSAAPVSLAIDTAESFLLFRLGRSGGEGSPEYVFASRYGRDGRAMWPGPLSVKHLERAPEIEQSRLVVEAGAEAAIRAALPGTAKRGGESVEILSDGTVVKR